MDSPLDFYNKYEADIEKWNANSNANNEDWQAMKDAYQLSSADKLQNYALQQALSATALADEKAIMSHSAYLDYENTKALMSEEQADKLQGMDRANELSKDYLSAESAAQESLAKVQGQQAVNLQAKANEASVYQSLTQKEAALGTALAQKAASEYGADRNLAGQVAQAKATEFSAREQREAAADTASKQLQGTQYASDADRFAKEYIADQQRQSAENVADTQRQSALETEQERSSGSLNVAKEQRAGQEYTADRSVDVAGENRAATEYSADRSLDVAKQQRAAAENVESTRQRGETTRNTATLASQEKQIGLRGQEERRTSRDKRQNAVEIAKTMSRRG